MAEQGGGIDWPSSALTLPAQPPASWRTSERTFVWAAKLNLPPSCQGIGKAVRGEEKGESGEGAAGGREGGKGGERGRQAGSSQSPSYSGHCPRKQPAAPKPEQPRLGTPKQGPDRQASRVRRRVSVAQSPSLRRCPRSVPPSLEGRGGKGRRRREKFAAGRGVRAGRPCRRAVPQGGVGGPGRLPWRAPASPPSCPGCLHSWSVF